MSNVVNTDEAWTSFSLQKEITAKEEKALKYLRISNLGPQFNDFSDTAAVIDHLDLVITVDSAVGHLAGAMGKRTWILLPFDADWRWLLERRDSPWYPTARLFRQSLPGDWDNAMESVCRCLFDLMESKIKRNSKFSNCST